MGDVFGILPSWDVYRHRCVVVFTTGRGFCSLYRRASREQAFVRYPGLAGKSAVMMAALAVMPIFHFCTHTRINMNTLKLLNAATVDSLITKDRMRVDVVVASCVCKTLC